MEIESEAKTAISKISSKYNFTWVIPHFEQLIERTPIKQFTLSLPFKTQREHPYPFPPLKDESTDYVWRLRLYPKDGDSNNHISVYLDGFQTSYEKRNNITTRRRKYNFEIFHLNRSDCSLKKLGNLLDLTSTWDFNGTKCWGTKNAGIFNNDVFPSKDYSIEVHLIICVCIFNDQNTILNECDGSNCKSLQKFSKFFGNDKLSDITFQLDCGSTIKASRILLMSQSTYFEKLLLGEWIESMNDVISIKDIDLTTFRAIIYYSYSGKLETGLNVEALKDIYLKADMWDMKEFNDLFLKTESLKYVHENWQDIKPSQNMKDFLFEAEVDWVEELMFARFFGFGKK
ncbi:3488_t:CDS:2 [Entrophospora sp. SA101]|nr:3488_t:CDS:2 [Entrophospora sp. SA101]